MLQFLSHMCQYHEHLLSAKWKQYRRVTDLFRDEESIGGEKGDALPGASCFTLTGVQVDCGDTRPRMNSKVYCTATRCGLW
jgi:hypothetical protein